MDRVHFLRMAIVLPVALLAIVMVLATEPRRDAGAEREFAQAVALQRAEQTLRREANHASRYFAVQYDVALSVLKQRLAEQVNAAHDVMQAIYDSASKQMPEDQVRALIRNSLRTVRFFEGRGYFFIDGMDGQVILMPLHPQLEGKMLLDNRDDQGTYIMQGLIEAAQQPGGSGYFAYRWYSPQDKTKMAEKIAYVRAFEPYDWFVGAGDYVPAIEEDIVAEAIMRMRAVRFGATGGIGLSSTLGDVVLLPETNQMGTRDGTDHAASSSSAVSGLWTRITQVATEGGGLLRFEWPHPETGRMEPRLAWVASLTANGRIVYASAHLRDFMPPEDDRVNTAFLTQDRAIAFAIFAIAATFIIVWVLPINRESLK